jgi:hopanoid-associated phosphorylase
VSRLGIVTGLIAEADRLTAAARSLPEPVRPLIAAVGGDTAKAETAVRGFARAGVAGLVSFGIAGGLDPTLVPGDIVLADRVLAPAGNAYLTDESWRLVVAAALAGAGPVRHGAVAGVEVALARPADKAALHVRTAALAVDMESHAVAVAAAEAGLPLLVLRAVADPVGRAIPSSALAGIGPDGRRRPFAVLAGLVARPWQVAGLMRIAGDSAAAMHSLTIAAAVLLDSGAD